MTYVFNSLVSVILISLISLLGALFMAIHIDKLQKIITSLVSLSVGALLGDVFFHIIPEIGKWTLDISLCSMAGYMFGFIAEKYIHQDHRHHHQIIPSNSQDSEQGCCNHEPEIKPMVTMNLIGDVLHNFIDGIIIATAYRVQSSTGLATTIAIVFHEIPQEIGDFAILIHGGLSVRKALFMNFVVSWFAIIGAILALFIDLGIEENLMAFGVGIYLYLVGSDLIPELHKHNGCRESILQITMIFIGLIVMGTLTLIE